MLSKFIIDEIMVGCFPELLTGKFSTAVVEPGTENRDSAESVSTEEMTIPLSDLALHAGNGVARELLVDPVCHGWRRALRMVGYLQSWVSILYEDGRL